MKKKRKSGNTYHFWEEDINNAGDGLPDGCPSGNGGIEVAREDAQRPDVEEP
jgi:hypothetical protein